MVLIGYWPLNETSGSTAYDRSGQDNHGTLNGGVTQGATGILGTSAYDFDGTDDLIDIPSRISSQAFTITAWINPDTTSGYDTVSRDWYSNNNHLMRLEGGQLRLYVQSTGGANYSALTSDTVSTNEWSLVVGRFDGSEVTAEIVGVDTDAASASITRETSNENWALGADIYNGEDYFDGRIADVRVYDHALTPSEVQYLYQVAQRGRLVTDNRRL